MATVINGPTKSNLITISIHSASDVILSTMVGLLGKFSVDIHHSVHQTNYQAEMNFNWQYPHMMCEIVEAAEIIITFS